jgi:hypothetical protein
MSFLWASPPPLPHMHLHENNQFSVFPFEVNPVLTNSLKIDQFEVNAFEVLSKMEIKHVFTCP